MAGFDWVKFFNEHNIPYATSGPNVTRGGVAIKCPFCGNDDPSEHLVVNLNGTNWWCWRRRTEHKGRSPEWLIQNLIHCSFDQARVITGGVAITDDFFNQIQTLLDPPAQVSALTTRELRFPKEFKSFAPFLPSSRPFVRYMTKRGFDEHRISTVFTKRYGLRYTTSGAFQSRIIFPVKQGGRLIGWTGRTLPGRSDIRYKALTTDEERAKEEGIEPALAPINNHLLWFDRLLKTDNDTICLTEGPFDALKVEELGRKWRISATAFFTTGPTDAQVGLLHELLPKFKHRYLIPDMNAVHFALQTSQKLSALGVEVKMLPDGVKDPGELSDLEFLFV